MRAQKLEKTKVQIAVGGKPLIYLPLSIAEARGYFKDEGLDVSIADFAGGSRPCRPWWRQRRRGVGRLRAHAGHAVQGPVLPRLRAAGPRAHDRRGRVEEGHARLQGPADLKGKKIGVTAPGSSTNMVVNFFLARHGLKASDVSIIGVGAARAR